MEDFAENEPYDKRGKKGYFYEVGCEVGRNDREQNVYERISSDA
jgi:hypothetical protein